MRTFSYLTVATVAILLACVSMAEEDKKKSRDFATGNPPSILAAAGGLQPMQIGQGTFRVKQSANGPFVAWAWRQSGPNTNYVEQWITHASHVTPGSAANVEWIFVKVTDGTQFGITTNPITFLNWVMTHGIAAGSGVPSQSDLDKHYMQTITVTPINQMIKKK